MCKIIAIANQKGGVGKTTTTSNLGIGLAKQGKRVLLIDADAQGSLTASLGFTEPDKLEETLATVMANIINDVEMEDDYGILRHEEGIDLMPGNIELSGLEVSLVNVMSRELVMRSYIEQVKERYDYILIDCMPSLGMITINAFACADSILIPVQAAYLPVKGLEQLIKTIGKVKRQINPKLSIEGILLTMVDCRTNYAKDISALLIENYGSKVRIFENRIPISVRAAEISAEGVSIYQHDPKEKVASAYQSLTEEVLGNNAIYGYRKSEEDKNQCVIDEEAAEVVRRIYRMSLEGKGPYEIARILSEEQIERPSYYLAKRGLGTCRSNNNTATPYVWRGATVRDIFSKPEYMGHTVNFRSYKESYKDKRAKKTPKEDWVIFKNTQEAIVSEEMWNKVQELRKTVRRTDTVGEANPFTGLLYCADCGAKMYNHRGGAGRARNWKGELNGKRRPDRDEYNCSTYNLSRQSYDKQCSQHYIRTEVVRKLVLETIKAVSDYVITNEEEFINRIYSSSRDKQKESIRSLKRQIAQDTKRVNELNMLMKKLYEDNISGKLSDKRFEFMLSEFENEQDTIEISMENAKAEIEKYESDTVRADKFIELVKRYTDFSELTTPMLNEFVEKILVHEADYSSGERVQEVEIYLNFIGKFELPVKEPTAEEIAEHEKLKARRAKKAEYNRRYMEKRRKRIAGEEQKSKEVTVNG